MQFNVRKFYLTFYAKDKNFGDIYVENILAMDKETTRVYNCIETIIDQIAEKMAELSDKDDARNLSDDENESNAGLEK